MKFVWNFIIRNIIFTVNKFLIIKLFNQRISMRKLVIAISVIMFVSLFSSYSFSKSPDDSTKQCSKTCEHKENCKGDKMHKDNTESGVKSSPVDSVKNTAELVCPVSGEKIDGAEGNPVKFTYLGKEYTFCCEGCVKKFKAEPMNYIKEELKCPVMGEAASKETFTVLDGVKYYFCCQPCVKKFEKNPEKYLNK
jgi:YHS domain-containing protein